MTEIELLLEGSTAIVRFNRPERLNAMIPPMTARIYGLAEELAGRRDIRALVLTGAGRAFCAGADVGGLTRYAGGESGGGAPTNIMGSVERFQANPAMGAPWPFSNLPFPTIAAVNGVAVGVGVEFATACDVRIAGESARFGWVFVHRGLVPDTGAGTWLLQRIVGVPAAAELLFSGEIIPATRALELGFVREVVPDAELMDRALALAAKFSRGAPLAVANVKRQLYRGLAWGPAEHLADHEKTINGLFATADFKEGIQSFLEKRDPAWKGA